jgi:hypothetical protein
MAASRVFTMLIVLFALASAALAQDALTETYVAPDGSFAFRYPAGWTIEEDEQFVALSDEDGSVIVHLYAAEYLSAVAAEGATALDVLEAVQPEFDDLITGDAVEVSFETRDSAYAEIRSDTQEGAAYVVPFSGGGYGMVQAFSSPGDFEPFLAIVNAIIATFDTPAEENTAAVTALTHYRDEWEATISELQTLELIAPGGSLVFHEDSAFFTGRGSFFTPLARNEPFADVVMAADLSFTQGDPAQIESCTLLARIGDNAAGDAETYVDVGFVTGGNVVVQDRFSATAEAASEVAELRLNLEQSHHLLLVLQNDVLDIYVDGELVFDDFLVADRSGSYGIALRSAARGARCEGENLWVYQTAPNTPGVCQIIAPDNANVRRGPGIQFDLYAQIAPGTTLEVIGQSVDGEGFTWWQLEDSNWVREDRVETEGECASVPVTQS